MPVDTDLRLMARDVGQEATAIVMRMLPRQRFEQQTDYLARIRPRWMELVTVMLNTAIDNAIVAEENAPAPVAATGNTSLTPDEMLSTGHGIMRCEFCESWTAVPSLELVDGCCSKCSVIVLLRLKATPEALVSVGG